MTGIYDHSATITSVSKNNNIIIATDTLEGGHRAVSGCPSGVIRTDGGYFAEIQVGCITDNFITVILYLIHQMITLVLVTDILQIMVHELTLKEQLHSPTVQQEETEEK